MNHLNIIDPGKPDAIQIGSDWIDTANCSTFALFFSAVTMAFYRQWVGLYPELNWHSPPPE